MNGKYCANMYFGVLKRGSRLLLDFREQFGSLSGQGFGPIARRNVILLHCVGALLSVSAVRFVKPVFAMQTLSQVYGSRAGSLV